MIDGIFVFAACVFLLAGTIKGMIGIGLPTASVTLLTQITDPRTAIALVVFPVMIANAWQVIRTGQVLQSAQTYGLFAVMLMITLLATTRVVASASPAVLLLALGLVIALFAATSLVVQPPALPDGLDKPAQFVAGTLAGFMGAFTAIWSPPMVIYFLARRLEKDEFVRASGFLIFLGSLPLAAGYWAGGLMSGPTALTSLAMVVPALIGFQVGEMIRSRLNTERFRTVVLVIFFLMGLNLIRKAVA
ncbi:MAG: sulfite exporter TauE/SafE family protein [Geminicoccaceae bacterium]